MDQNAQERMKERDRQLEAKFQDKLKADRQLQQKRNNSTVIYIIFASTLVVFAILLAILLGDGWYHRKLTGFGFLAITIQTSLFEITFDVKCGKNSVEDLICHGLLKAAKGTWSLHGAQSDLCALNGSICSIFKEVYQCSFIIFGAAAITFLSQLFGMIVLANYWFVSPLPRLKTWAFFLLTFGFISLVAGIVAWTFLVPDLTQVLMMVNQQLGGVSGGILTFQAANDFLMYGWCWALGLFACVIMVLQFGFVALNFRSQEGEDEAIDAEYSAYDEKMDERMALAMAQNAGQNQPYYGAA